jgi:uncharacterized membrane protein
MLFSNFLFTAVPAVPLALLNIPQAVDPEFYWALPVSAIALVLARFSLINALSESELSATIPLIAFAPLLISITSFGILGERVGSLGFIGIGAIVLGSYLLRVRSARTGILEPFRVLSREKGARLMLGAALGFSLAAPMAKLAINSSSTYFAFGVAQVLSILLVGGWLAVRGRLRTVLQQSLRHFGRLSVIGSANFLQAITTYIAFDLMLVAYVAGIKGSNILMTALVGHLAFNEGRIKRSLVVGMVMVAGIVLLSLQP